MDNLEKIAEKDYPKRNPFLEGFYDLKVEHWKRRWIEWWSKWPNGVFPRNTQAYIEQSKMRNGRSAQYKYEGQIKAAEEITSLKFVKIDTRSDNEE